MISRRTLIKSGLASGAAAGWVLPATVQGKGTGSQGIDAMLLDRRYVPGDMAEMFGPRVHAFSGDVTAVWFETLDPLWRRPGFVLGGITGQDSLFVLERLAWDRGRRVVERRELDARGTDDRAVVRWVIAPVHPSVLHPGVVHSGVVHSGARA